LTEPAQSLCQASAAFSSPPDRAAASPGPCLARRDLESTGLISKAQAGCLYVTPTAKKRDPWPRPWAEDGPQTIRTIRFFFTRCQPSCRDRVPLSHAIYPRTCWHYRADRRKALYFAKGPGADQRAPEGPGWQQPVQKGDPWTRKGPVRDSGSKKRIVIGDSRNGSFEVEGPEFKRRGRMCF
jgi:hypothetical protein